MMGGFGGGGMGSPLLTALLSGGLGYVVGSSAGQQQMSAQQNARIGQLEQQQQSAAAPYSPSPAYPSSQGTPAPQAAPQAVGAPASTTESDRLAQLKLLAQLHESGALTDAEYELEKQKILHG